jgi:hypothetical protein
MQDSDGSKLVTLSNASPVAVTLPRAGASSWFLAGWSVEVQNRGAGNVTITPVTSTIDGAASLVLTQNQGARIFSDGSNYFTERGIGGAGFTLPGTGAVKVTSGVAGLVPGSAGDCVKVDGSSAPCGGFTLPGTGAVKVTSGVAGLVSGNAADCVKVDGSSAPCGGGGGTASTHIVAASFDGAGVPLTGTATTCSSVPYNGTLTGIRLLASPAGSATVDVRTETDASYNTSGPASAATITGTGAIPAISSAYGASPSITGFNTAFAANTTVCFVLTNPSVATNVTAVLTIDETGGGGGAPATHLISAVFDGAGTALSGTATTCTAMPYAGTLTGVRLLANPAGSATVDIRSATNASFGTGGPASATTITGTGAIPAISSAYGVSPSIAGFNTTLAANTTVCFVLSNPSTASNVTAILTVTEP